VLVTPARNEAQFIEKTLSSVIAQSVLPLEWVIVSDRSTDGTDDIIKKCAAQNGFIRFVRREATEERDFSSKVQAVRLGLSHLQSQIYGLIGFLDADLSFNSDYFAQILEMFQSDARLGVAGGICYERSGDNWSPVRTAVKWSVSGGMQMFRRDCYEGIGGYLPLEKGGIDTVAEVMARMMGWSVMTNPKLVVLHYRSMGTAKGGVLRARFVSGWREYTVGYDPVFVLVKSLARFTEWPYIIGALCRLAGYLSAWWRTRGPVVPEAMIRFLRGEQRARLLSYVGIKNRGA
jgi:glycosyltransferase involved in cell wall biosynthesis